MVFFMSLGSLAAWLGIEFEAESWASFMGVETLICAIGIYPLRPCSLANLWFLRSLIAFVAVAPIFSFFFRKKYLGLFSFAVMSAVCIFLPNLLPSDMKFESRFFVNSWADGILSFGVGVFLRWNGDWLSSIVVRKGRVCLGWVLLTCGLTAPIVNVCYGVWAPVIVSAFMLMAGAWLVIPDMHLPKFLTSMAFPMYVIHGFVIFLVAIVTRVTGLRPFVQTSNVAYMVQVVLAIVICVIAVSWMRKLFPRFSSMVFGGR